METVEILEDVRALKKDIDIISKLLYEIVNLEKEPLDNLYKLITKVNKLNEAACQLQRRQLPIDEINEWTKNYRRRQDDLLERNKIQFGTELENHLKSLNMPLSGQYPKLRAGWFTLELDAAQGTVKLWYGPEQSYLAGCRFSVREVKECLQTAQASLGSDLSKAEFAQRLKEACRRAAGEKLGERVPIMRVFKQIVPLIEEQLPEQTEEQNRRQKYRPPDFSYDLYRLFHESHPPEVQMIVSTRSHTQNKGDFLWIPDNINSGTTYSHIKFREDKT